MHRLLAVLLSFQLAVAPAAWAASAEDRSAPPPQPEPQASSTPPTSSVQAGQTAPPGQSQAAGSQEQGPPDTGLPVSLARIRKGLSSETPLKLDLPIREDIPRYYMEVNATPDFSVFLQGFDLKYGPVPGAGMTHQEFMQMVTPKDLYSQAGFGGLDVLTANLSFAAIMYLATKAFNAMREAKSERELQRVREQIQRELADLQKANAARKKPGGSP